MQLHNLQPAEGSVKKKRRIGRGEGSGSGVTSGKGNKGQQARTGYQSKKGFEGGQMPIQRRMPKRGFKNRNRVEYVVFNLGDIEALVGKYGFSEFSLDTLYVHGLISRTDLVKVLGTGELKSKVAIKVNAASAKAKEAIEAAGSTIELY